MIKNPFFYRAADVQTGNMADDRVFVNLFGISALELLKEKIQNLWDMPLILLSAPGGGKSSLMRIFTPGALRYIKETASRGGNQKGLAKRMEELGAFRNGDPYALGIWFRISDEFRSLESDEKPGKYGLFFSMLNARIILNAINSICELKGLDIINDDDLNRISFLLKPNVNRIAINSWKKWGADNGKEVYGKMADLEADLCDMIDDPFWSGDPSHLTHTKLWSLDLLANLEVFIDAKPFKFRPLVMLDDVHELSEGQKRYLLSILTSRQVALPFWISMRKQALGLEELLTERVNKGVDKERDYQIIDFEKSKGDFKKRAFDISKLRVQEVAPRIGALSQEFVSFLSDDREEIFLENFDQRVALEIKAKILTAAGKELERFEKIIREVENQDKEIKIHDLCRRLRRLEILVQREVNKPQKSFLFNEVPTKEWETYERNNSITEAAELFLAKEYKLPYYFGANRLVILSSFNILQFLQLAGNLFEEVMTAIRLGRDGESFLSPERQDAIIRKATRHFLKQIPVMVPNGSAVFRFVTALGEMCRQATYRVTAPYAPGVTGTAFEMNEYEFLKKSAQKGNEKYKKLYQAIESAVAHNILEPEPNLRCKGKRFLVLYLNRLLCVPYNLPLQRGGFREQKLNTFFQWLEVGYKKPGEGRGRYLWE
jgi:hypothetical protein